MRHLGREQIGKKKREDVWVCFIASFSRKALSIHLPLVFFFPFNHYQWFYRGKECEAYFPEPKVQKL
jgi:hypothetical protein